MEAFIFFMLLALSSACVGWWLEARRAREREAEEKEAREMVWKELLRARERIHQLESYVEVDLLWQQTLDQQIDREAREIEESELWKTDPEEWVRRHRGD